MSYIKPVPGLPSFAMVSAVSIIDPLLTYPHRLVLSILALHAKTNGETRPSQEHIARMAGWFTKDKAGNRVPNKSYVSSLICNDNHTKKSDRCGPGLVQLGYVKQGHRQQGFNQANLYYLSTPEFRDGLIHRPDGSATEARFTASVPRENTKVYKARKAAEQEAYEVKTATPKNKFSAADQIPSGLPGTYLCNGEKYTSQDCLDDLADWHDGFERNVPDAVYYHFKVTIPSRRESIY